MDLSELVHNHRSGSGANSGVGDDRGGDGAVVVLAAAAVAATRPPLSPVRQTVDPRAWACAPDLTTVNSHGNEASRMSWPVLGEGRTSIARPDPVIAPFGKRLRDCDDFNARIEHVRSLEPGEAATGWPASHDVVGSVDTSMRSLRPALSGTAAAAATATAASGVDEGRLPVSMRDVGEQALHHEHAGMNISLREHGLLGLRSESVDVPWAMQVEATPRSDPSTFPGLLHMCHSSLGDGRAAGLYSNIQPVQDSQSICGRMAVAVEHPRVLPPKAADHDSDRAGDDRSRYDAPRLQRLHQENPGHVIGSGDLEPAANASVPRAVVLTCDICERTFHQQSMFDSHMAVFHRRSATPTKPRSASFSCQYCGKGTPCSFLGIRNFRFSFAQEACDR
jgi:hypothetical protein